MRVTGLIIALIVVLVPLRSASGQTPPTQQIDEHIADIMAREKKTINPPRETCDSQGGNEIVVCAHRDDPDRYRVRSSSEENPYSRNALDTGVPQPPNVYGGPPCLAFCVTVHPGNAPPPIYYIDLKQIPRTPLGSDADKIAKGEIRAP
jgi:hypothetical protein